MDAIRGQLAGLDNLLDFGNHQSGRGGRRLVEVVFRHAVLEIARRVRPPSADEGDIGPQRRNEHHLLAVYDPGLAPLPQGGAGASRREKTAQAGPAGAQGLRQCALGQKLHFQLPRLRRRNGLGVGGEERAYGLFYLSLAQTAPPR